MRAARDAVFPTASLPSEFKDVIVSASFCPFYAFLPEPPGDVWAVPPTGTSGT